MSEAEIDVTLLKVKGNIAEADERKRYVKQLSQAVMMVVQKHGKAKMRCIGAAAISNATKAHIIANGEVSKRGELFVCVPSFKTVLFDGTVEKTSIVLEIRVSKDPSAS